MARVATLIVNPAAGRASLFHAQLPSLTALLTARGYTAQVLHTTSEPASGRTLARQSLHSALLLACGGDGTVHDVLQGIAHTGVPLGVLPLGTANALARNLSLPLEPLACLTRLLTFTPRSVPLGELTTAQGTRLFTVMAGCGPDGALVHTLPDTLKRTLGRTAYYAHAARLFATRRWPAFQVDYLPAAEWGSSAAWRKTRAVAVMASRVADLGGLFSGLTPRARLHHPSLHVQLLRAPAHLALPAWFARLPNPLLTTVNVTELRCTPLSATAVHAQADAEPAGTVPLSMRLLPDALLLLMPHAF